MTKKCCSVCHRPMSDDECGDEFPDERVCDRCAQVVAPEVDLPTYFAEVRELYAAHDAEIKEFGVHASEAAVLCELDGV